LENLIPFRKALSHAPDGLISNAIAIAVIAKAEIPLELRTKP
jgi:hypothetical protein